MAELWSLLHFIMPSLFDNHDEFREWFSRDIEQKAVSESAVSCSLLASNTHVVTSTSATEPGDLDAVVSTFADEDEVGHQGDGAADEDEPEADSRDDTLADLSKRKSSSSATSSQTASGSLPMDQLQVQRLHMILKPFMLRRVRLLAAFCDSYFSCAQSIRGVDI